MYVKANAIKVVDRWIVGEQLGKLSGWVSIDRDESERTEVFVEKVLEKLKVRDAALAGIDKRIEKVLSLCEHSIEKVVRVGIWGADGVEKKKLARAVFRRISATFEDSCFIENVTEVLREHGAIALWRKLWETLNVEDFSRGILTQKATVKKRLQRAKVLLVFDDVDDLFLMKFFRWVRDERSFAEGSKVIFTSRDRDVLRELVGIEYVVYG